MTILMNKRPLSGGGQDTRNDCFRVLAPADRQTGILSVRRKPRSRQRGVVVIIQHVAPDAYGLLILALEIALDSGWLGGDRVVGRAAVRDLLIKAGRFNDDERRRMTIHLPDKAITLRLDEVERHLGG